jgi:hypothetical protein
VLEAHKEVEVLEQLIKDNFGRSVELFAHTDACMDFSCKICIKKDCSVRKFSFRKKIDWTVENISTNNRHRFN